MDTARIPSALLDAVRREGFQLAGVASAAVLHDARRATEAARAAGQLDGLHWMTPDWIARATDPAAFLAGARSLLVLALPYQRAASAPADVARGRIAAYAAGRDYHRAFESRLRRLARFIRDELGASARSTVDYGPLLERPLAVAAGLGWQGKSTMLLVPGLGPRVLLGVIATSLDFPVGTPLRKTCGACTRCITACPTGALDPAGNLLDARRCISYHTIENRGPIPRDLRPLFGAWVFGCDECLDSCPVGAGSAEGFPDFAPRSADDAFPALTPLLRLDDEGFAERFRGRAVMRAKRDGFVRNVCVALGNVGMPEDLAPLAEALADRSPLVRGHAAWAIARLAGRHAEPPTPRGALSAVSARLVLEDDAFVRDELALARASLLPLTGGDLEGPIPNC